MEPHTASKGYLKQQENHDPEVLSDFMVHRDSITEQNPSEDGYEGNTNPSQDATGTEMQLTLAPDVINIAEDGDLIAIISSHNLRFRVHSVILKLRSSAIAGTITNAQNNPSRRQNEPVEVILPKYDPEAFEALCAYFHKPTLRALPMSVELLLKVATLAKEWQCIDELVHATDYWLRELQTTPAWFSADSCWDLTIAALYFESVEWFWVYTSRLLQLHDSSFLCFAEKIPDSLQLLKLAYALEENRHLRAPEDQVKLRFEGVPPGTAAPAYQAFTQRTDIPDMMHFSSILMQPPYRMWSTDELRLADYLHGNRYGFGCGAGSTSNTNPFRPSRPLGLCLKCFNEAADSFKPRTDCETCLPRRTGEIVVNDENVNILFEIVRRLSAPASSVFPQTKAQALGAKSFFTARPSTGSTARSTPQMALFSPGRSGGPVGNVDSKQPMVATGTVFDFGSKEPTQKSKPVPQSIYPGTGDCSFGSRGESAFGAAPQQPPKFAPTNPFDSVSAHSTPGNRYHFVGDNSNKSPKSEITGTGLFGWSQSPNVASKQSIGSSGGLFGQSLGRKPTFFQQPQNDQPPLFGSAPNINADSTQPLSGGKGHFGSSTEPGAASGNPHCALNPVLSLKRSRFADTSDYVPPAQQDSSENFGTTGGAAAAPNVITPSPSAERKAEKDANKRLGSQEPKDRNAKRQRH